MHNVKIGGKMVFEGACSPVYALTLCWVWITSSPFICPRGLMCQQLSYLPVVRVFTLWMCWNHLLTLCCGSGVTVWPLSYHGATVAQQIEWVSPQLEDRRFDPQLLYSMSMWPCARHLTSNSSRAVILVYEWVWMITWSWWTGGTLHGSPICSLLVNDACKPPASLAMKTNKKPNMCHVSRTGSHGQNKKRYTPVSS